MTPQPFLLKDKGGEKKMKKLIASSVLAVIIATMALVACQKKEEAPAPAPAPAPAVQQPSTSKAAPAPAPAPAEKK